MANTKNGMGDRWTQGGMTYTVNPTNDPKAGQGGYYVSVTDNQTGDKSTAVYDSNDNLISFK